MRKLNLIQEMSAKGVRSLKADSPKKIYLKRPDNVKWRKIVNADEVRVIGVGEVIQ